MRTSFVALAGSLLLSACVSGTRVVYVPVPADGTAPAPVVRPLLLRLRSRWRRRPSR